MKFPSFSPILVYVKENLYNGSKTGEAIMAIQAISSVTSSNALASTLAVSNPATNEKARGSAPAGKPGGGGAPKAKPASGTSSSSDTKIYDRMDTNKDGTVSAQEKAAYLVVHPEDAAQNTESTNYNGNGKNPENQVGLPSIINLSA
jgi:hypothetical protein